MQVLKTRTAKYAQELSALKSSCISDTTAHVIEKLRGEKKYILESLKGIKYKINKELDFYRGKLIFLAHNYENASKELSETRDRLENIRRLYVLCGKLSSIPTHVTFRTDSEREDPNSEQFADFDAHNARLLAYTISVETETAEAGIEIQILKDGLRKYFSNLTLDNKKLHSWLLSQGLMEDYDGPDTQ